MQDPDDFGPEDVQTALEVAGWGRIWNEAVAYLDGAEDEESEADHDPEPDEEVPDTLPGTE